MAVAGTRTSTRHSHIWTPDVAHYPLAAGFTVADMKPQSFTAEELLATCRPAGVGRVNLIQMSYYEFDNRYMLDMIKLYPERFVGTAIVDPLARDPGEAMRDAGAKRGVHAFRIQPQYSKLPPARWLEPPGYAAMFATAAQTGQALSCLIDPDGFPEVDRMCRPIPRHDGHHRPPRPDRRRPGRSDPRRRRRCALRPGQAPASLRQGRGLLRPGQEDAALPRPGPADPAASSRPSAPRRCMWESDCPFQVVKDRYADSLALIRDRLDFLSKDDRDWLLFRTAEQLVFGTLKS